MQTPPDTEGVWLKELREFLRLPSSNSNDAGLSEAGHWLKDRLAQSGWDVHAAGTPPLIAATRGRPVSPLLLVYSHYDVMTPLETEWTHPPFGAEQEDGLIFACGARDSKANLLGAIHACERHFRAAPHSPLRVMLVFEGEEKRESPHLLMFVRDQLQGAAPTGVICADGGGYTDRDEPTIELGLKGQVGINVELAHPMAGISDTSIHSGHSSLATNPNDLLVRLLASLKTTDGRVNLDGFYDGVQPPMNPYREPLSLADASFLQTLLDRYKYSVPVDRTTADVLNRLMFEPELNIASLMSGETGTERRIVPRRARAYIDISLVPGQVPATIIKSVGERLKRIGLPIESLQVVASRLAYRCPPDDPLAINAARAYGQTHSESVVVLPSSGSSGPVSTLPVTFGCQMVRIGTGYRGHAHTADEAIRIQHYLWYVEALATLFANLSSNLPSRNTV
jgi:acetylornithine deacetylase/succinyl-diaminopimelate desuccinylase-like protein